MRELTFEETQKIYDEHKFTEFSNIVRIKGKEIVSTYNRDIPNIGRFPRRTWRVQLECQGRTVWISKFEQSSKEVDVKVMNVLSCLRVDISLLFGENKDYEKWKEIFIDNMGEGNGNTKRSAWILMCSNERRCSSCSEKICTINSFTARKIIKRKVNHETQ